MKIVRFILILAITSVLASCSQENQDNSPEIGAELLKANVPPASPCLSDASEKPFSNPVLIYGSSFGNYFQTLYKTGQFDHMMKFTSSESIEKFGRDKILEFYKNMDFAYSIKLKSKNDNDGVTTLNYEAGIMATRSMVRIDVVLENDTCKILLSDLKSLK
jgi:hypothetical protein